MALLCTLSPVSLSSIMFGLNLQGGFPIILNDADLHPLIVLPLDNFMVATQMMKVKGMIESIPLASST